MRRIGWRLIAVGVGVSLMLPSVAIVGGSHSYASAAAVAAYVLVTLLQPVGRAGFPRARGAFAVSAAMLYGGALLAVAWLDLHDRAYAQPEFQSGVLAAAGAVVLALGVVGSWCYARWLAEYAAGERQRRGACRRCGYDLRGNTSGVCPECGGTVASHRIRG